MIWNQREQKESLERYERKFSEEKMRLQQESNKKIAEIAEHAQDEAIKYEKKTTEQKNLIYIFFFIQNFR